MTRALTKAVPFFPDWKRVLERAAEVRTVPVRRCEICASESSALIGMATFDGFVCEDVAGCMRRENKARRVR